MRIQASGLVYRPGPGQWIRGADLSLVVVGRSFTVANGFVPLKREDDGKCYWTPHALVCLLARPAEEPAHVRWTGKLTLGRSRGRGTNNKLLCLKPQFVSN